MKYTKCPICEEKLRNGICPMCGYDFTRLKQQNQMEKDYWDVLTRDQKTKTPVFAHDKKKHSDENKKKNNVYKQEKKKNRKISKIFIFILIAIIYLLSFLSEAAPEIFEHIKQMINHIYI